VRDWDPTRARVAELASAGKLDDAIALLNTKGAAQVQAVQQHFTQAIDAVRDRAQAVSYTHLDVYKRQEFTITKQFLDDLAEQNFLNRLATMKKALLVCHAPLDEYVSIDNASTIFTAARHPKSFLLSLIHI